MRGSAARGAGGGSRARDTLKDGEHRESGDKHRAGRGPQGGGQRHLQVTQEGEKMKIRAIVKRPDELIGHVTNIENSLENLQRTVEGYIETVTFTPKELYGGSSFVVICNEGGRLFGLDQNCTVDASTIYNLRTPVSFVGTIAVVGVDGDEFADCPLTRKYWAELIKPMYKQQITVIHDYALRSLTKQSDKELAVTAKQLETEATE